MRNRHRHSTQRIDSLRLTIDCLPTTTREAMLEGLRANERIIVGAYVDDHGGVCPMLAAHRCGGRTDFLAFAKSWDRFTRVKGASRPASARELGILIRLLESSLEGEGSASDLAGAIAEHRQLRDRDAPGGRLLGEDGDPRGTITARRLLRRAGRLLPGRHAVEEDLERVPVAGSV